MFIAFSTPQDLANASISQCCGCRSVSGKGVIRPSGLCGFEADAQDLKSCEGFPRVGSSPTPGTLLTLVLADLSLLDSTPKGPCARGKLTLSNSSQLKSKPLLALFYPPHYNRSKKEIPITRDLFLLLLGG